MYLGRIVELADKALLFARPRHPYTRMLLDASPTSNDGRRARGAGRGPESAQPAERLHVQSALPPCQRALSRRAAAAATIDGVQVACHAVEEGRT